MAEYKNGLAKPIKLGSGTADFVNVVNNTDSTIINKIILNSQEDINVGFDLKKDTDYVIWTRSIPIKYYTGTGFSVSGDGENDSFITENYTKTFSLQRPKYRGTAKIEIKGVRYSATNIKTTDEYYNNTDLMKSIGIASDGNKAEITLTPSYEYGKYHVYSSFDTRNLTISGSVENCTLTIDGSYNTKSYKYSGSPFTIKVKITPTKGYSYNGSASATEVTLTINDAYLAERGVTDDGATSELSLSLPLKESDIVNYDYTLPYLSSLTIANSIVDGISSGTRSLRTLTILTSTDTPTVSNGIVSFKEPIYSTDNNRKVTVNITKSYSLYYAYAVSSAGRFYNTIRSTSIGKFTKDGITYDVYKYGNIDYSTFTVAANKTALDNFLATNISKNIAFATNKVKVTINRLDTYTTGIKVTYYSDKQYKTVEYISGGYGSAITSLPFNIDADYGRKVEVSVTRCSVNYRQASAAKTIYPTSAQTVYIGTEYIYKTIIFAEGTAINSRGGTWDKTSASVIKYSKIKTVYDSSKPYQLIVYSKAPDESNFTTLATFTARGYYWGSSTCYNNRICSYTFPVDPYHLYFGINVKGVGRRYTVDSTYTTYSESTYDLKNQPFYHTYDYIKDVTDTFTIYARTLATKKTISVTLIFDKRYFNKISYRGQSYSSNYEYVASNNSIWTRSDSPASIPCYAGSDLDIFVAPGDKPSWNLWSAGEVFGPKLTVWEPTTYTLEPVIDSNVTFLWSTSRNVELDNVVGSYYNSSEGVLTSNVVLQTILSKLGVSKTSFDNIRNDINNWAYQCGKLEYSKKGSTLTRTNAPYQTYIGAWPGYKRDYYGDRTPNTIYDITYSMRIGFCPKNYTGDTIAASYYNAGEWNIAFSLTSEINSSTKFITSEALGKGFTFPGSENSIFGYAFIPITFTKRVQYNSSYGTYHSGYSYGDAGYYTYGVDSSKTQTENVVIILRYPVYFKP